VRRSVLARHFAALNKKPTGEEARSTF